MRKVFWDNPYQQSIKTTISAVKNNEILLQETIAYSFSGGQESDKATINDIPILNSRMADRLIYYTLPEGHGFSVGEEITLQIDWPRRYRLMRLHFAAELILEIVTQKYQLEKVGAHIAENKARIDFLSVKNISSLFDEILIDYNEIIKANRVIETGYLDVENQRRYWQIDGFAKVPCGGTHVKSTAEVGYVTLKRSHPGKGIERVEIVLFES